MRFLIINLVVSLNFAGATADAQSVETISDPQQKIAALKKEILRISEQASSSVKYDSEDNDPQVRAKLDALINRLVGVAPKRSQAETLVDVVGAWKSVWSDLSYFGPFSPRVESIYQIVFPDGYYYNLSIYDLPDSSYTSVIKGNFTVQEPALGIEFVKTSRYSKLFKNKSDLATLAMRAELGAYDEMIDPLNAPGIGFKSTFEQIYVDDEIRIGRGANSTGFSSLFVLKRATKFKRSR